MNKELYLFKELLRCSGINESVKNNPQFKEEVSLIEKALKRNEPPTEEEVCEALSEYFDKNVIYKARQLYVAVSKINKYNVYNFVNINALKSKPHLITMIGRFLEAQNKKVE